MSGKQLQELQSAAGAQFADSGDRCHDESAVGALSSAPLHFGDPEGEYDSAKRSAALFDTSDRTQIEVEGRDRGKFLHNFCTNDVQSLKPGSGCEAFITNVKGRLLGHLFLFADVDRLSIESVPGSEEGLLAHLDRYLINEDVTLTGRTSEFGTLTICGPQVVQKLRGIGLLVDELQLLEHCTTSVANIEISIRRVDAVGIPSYSIVVHRNKLAELWQALCHAEFAPAGALAYEALRIENCFPTYGVDISEENLAQEAARTAPAVSFKKGCYLGQEPIARIDAIGHVNRELRGLKLPAGSDRASVGSLVLSTDGQQEIGRISSAAVSYADNSPVALACVRRGFTQPGTMVLVQADDSREPVLATVFWRDELLSE